MLYSALNPAFGREDSAARDLISENREQEVVANV